MGSKNTIINAIFILLFIVLITYSSLFINLHYFAKIMLLISFLLSLIIFFIFEKQYNKLSKIIKFLIILNSLFFFGILIETWHMFIPYPTIAITQDYDKAQTVQKYIMKTHATFAEINEYQANQSLYLHTYSHKKFDKIAIALADSDLFDNTVKIGIYCKPSDNPQIHKKRLEECYDKRIKLISGVKSVKTNIPNYNRVTINVVINKNADKNRIYTIISNFLPMPNENKTIIINKE